MFYVYTEKYKHNEFFKDKTNLYNMYKIKLHKTSKCLWPPYKHMFVVESFFFDIFINHFPRIPRSVLRKITIDLLYFWNAYGCQSIRNVRYHSPTLLQRNQAQARPWFVRLHFLKKKKRNNKCFDNRHYSLFFLMNIF